MKKVLVTGGAGVIGTNLIKKLLADKPINKPKMETEGWLDGRGTGALRCPHRGMNATGLPLGRVVLGGK